MSDQKHSLSDVAACDELFLKRDIDFHIKRLSLKELAGLLVHVIDLLETLRQASPPQASARAFPPGKGGIDPTLDFTYIANLDHLLLCLQDQIVHLLVARGSELVQKHLEDCQKDHNKHVKDWFFEYPDARHPLSTTWPWSIKPSLAVIWGVCWMFYNSNEEPRFDEYGNMVDVQGNVVVPHQIVQTYLLSRQQIQWQQRSPGEQRMFERYSAYGQQLMFSLSANADQEFVRRQAIMAQAQPRYSPSHPPISGPAHQAMSAPQQATSTSISSPIPHTRESFTVAPFLPIPRAANRKAEAGDARVHAEFGLASQSTNNTYTQGSAAPSSAWNGGAVGAANERNWLPEVQNFSPDLGFDTNNAYTAQSWQHFPHQPVASEQLQQPGIDYSPQALPQSSRRGQLTPTIRLTTDFSSTSEYQLPPQDSTLSSASSQHFSPHDQFQQYTYQNQTHLSPHTPRFGSMATLEQQPPPSQSELPVSPISRHGSPHVHSPNGMPSTEPMTRKRSHSQMSHGDAPRVAYEQPMYERPVSRAGSTGAHSHSGNDYPDSPAGSRAFKRGDPPQNQDGKYICEYDPACGGQTFDRKCEWRWVQSIDDII